MKVFWFMVDVVTPALTTVVLVTAGLVYVYVEDIWVFSPSAWVSGFLRVSGMGGS